MEKHTVGYITGILCTVICNILKTTGDYVLKGFECSPADVTFVKGTFQSVVFAITIFYLIVIQGGKKALYQNIEGKNENQGNEEKHDKNLAQEITILPTAKSDKAWTLAFGICNGIKYASLYGAVLFIPISLHTILMSVTPICTYVFSRFLLQIKFTILKTVICVSVMGGICLVQQSYIWFPDSIEGFENDINLTSNPTKIQTTPNHPDTNLYPSNNTVILESTSQFTGSYWIGVTLSFTFAISASLNNLIPNKCNYVSVYTLMFWAGIGDIVISFFCLLLPNVVLSTVFSPHALTKLQWLFVFILGMAALLANQLTMYGNRVGSPVVNSVIVRSEVLIALFIDAIFFDRYPNYAEIVGYGIVLLSVFGMIFANKIQDWIDDKLKVLAID